MSETVGDIVGPISPYDISSSAGIYMPSGVPYDVAIGGLPFVLAPRDDRPYARETAEFRTQQVDVSQQAGDQSLTGWWTRGQFTFHRGEGITYYELLQDTGITGRYNSGDNCYAWRQGEVRLSNAMTQVYTGAVNKVIGTANENVAFLLGDGVGWSQDLFRLDLSVPSSAPVAGVGSFLVQDACEWPDGGCLVIDNGVIKSVSLDGLTVTTIATLTAGAFWRVFWAKDRIFAMDQNSKWYAFSDTAGQTIDVAVDFFWQGPTEQAGSLTMTDGPGAAYIGISDRVYAVELDSSGVVPTVTSPRVVAQLPYKRTIQGLLWHGGYLVIQGFGGVRIAQDQGNGNLILGPEVIADLGSATLAPAYMGSYRDYVRLVGRVRGAASITAIDLNMAEFTSELVPAYSTRKQALGPVDTSRSVGWTNVGYRTMITWTSEGAWMVEEAEGTYPDGVETSGYVQTGFHRYGVLEPKVFHSLSVRAKGSAGTVSVAIIRKDGAVQPLLTMGPDQYQEANIGIPPIGSTEVIAFRFTLAGPSNMTDDQMPKLLGYQIKALPAPERQRMIQVPLMCYDFEKIGGPDYGHKGWAWKRLEALEQMETNSGIITFQDFNTGEQRQAYIERVQFQQTVPPKAGGKEFGGIVVVTLRCVTA